MVMPFNPARELGERIKSARQQKSFTQEDLAEAMGMSTKTIFSWERGDYSPNRRKLLLMAKALDVDAEWLINGEGQDVSC